MTKGYYVVRTRDGEMPEYFYGRNYKWFPEPRPECIYKDRDRATKALEKCINRYGDNRTRFTLVGVDDTVLA